MVESFLYFHNTILLADVSSTDVILLVVLLMLSMFFSASETVFASVNVIRLKTFAEEKRTGSAKALWVSNNFDKTLSTILFGNNVANIGLTVVSTTLFFTIFDGIYSAQIINIIATLSMTTIVLIFGEILPKSFAKQRADRWSLYLGPVLYYLIHILLPVVFPFILIRKLFFRKTYDADPTVTEDELETILDTMEDEGIIDEDEADMIESILSLKEKSVYEIMTPRIDVIAIEKSMNVEEVKELFFTHKYSRLPVYDKDKDNIIGIVNERDFLTCLVKNKEYVLEELMSEPFYVSKSMKVDKLLESLQHLNSHLAIVVGEYGGTSGIVTLEDALEEVVGEIYDEHDDHIASKFILQLSENKYNIDTSISTNKLFNALDIDHDLDQKYMNVASWIYELSEELPEEGDVVRFEFNESEYEDDQMIEYRYEFIFNVKKILDKRIMNATLTVNKSKVNKKEENSKRNYKDETSKKTSKDDNSRRSSKEEQSRRNKD